MDPFDLARNDGSKNAAGRGSGMDKGDREDGRQVPDTPYMLMTFAPLERRLDVAIFRAMFASSTRQARQFVIHGGVTVNGKKVGLLVPFTSNNVHFKQLICDGRCNILGIY